MMFLRITNERNIAKKNVGSIHGNYLLINEDVFAHFSAKQRQKLNGIE